LEAIDPLTWLPTRRRFERRLAQALRGLSRSRRTLAVLLLDLDRLEHVNATLGSGLGDRIVREAAARMARALPAGTALSRLESDDFAVVREVRDLAEAAGQAAALLARCREPYVIDCVAVTVTMSIGIALSASPEETSAQVLARAERALFEAKVRGRDRFYPGAATPA
jgi:diguanylate cyclase (GGDEF)-like protein